MAALPPITNLVVLMLENRSFDNVLGCLYPYSSNFEGLKGTESNTDWSGTPYTIANNKNTTLMPPVDPGESFEDMNLQIWGNTAGTGSQSMSGFVKDYLATPTQPGGIRQFPPLPYAHLPRPLASAQDIMNYFTTIGSTPQLPVTGQLAQSFAVTDSWFGSCPTQTYANRMFLICGTAGGYVDDVQYLLYDHAYKSAPNYTSVFERLDAGGSSPANWKIYFHDLCLAGLVNLYAANAFTDKNNGNICNFDSSMPNPITPTFLADVAAGTLPRFSLIEPRYETLSALSIIANDNHPPHDMIYGEILLATVYNAIRKSAYWTNKNIMLIVTYDEHGGCYDHVAAPAAINPGVSLLPPAPLPHWIPPIPPYKLAPNLFGPRVPTLIISPWVNSSLPSKSAFRPPNFTPNQPSSVTPFDHTSIISTLNLFFNIGTLTQRDAAAPPLGTNVPNLYGDGSNAGPPSVPVPTPPESVVKQQLAQPPTGLGRKLPPMEPPR